MDGKTKTAGEAWASMMEKLKGQRDKQSVVRVAKAAFDYACIASFASATNSGTKGVRTAGAYAYNAVQCLDWLRRAFGGIPDVELEGKMQDISEWFKANGIPGISVYRNFAGSPQLYDATASDMMSAVSAYRDADRRLKEEMARRCGDE